MANPTDVFNAANAAADQQIARIVAPGPGAVAAARGLTPSGFPIPQPGQGGTLLGLANMNGAQAGVPQPQPVGARMMGTVDPTAGWPSFANGTGAPAGFSPAAAPAPAQASASVQPVANAAAMPANNNYGFTAPAALGGVTNPAVWNQVPLENGNIPLPDGSAGGGAGVGGPAAAADTRVRAAIPSFNGVAAPANAGVQVYRGMNGAAGGSGQVGAFRDPSGPISAGFQAQQAYGQGFLNQALDYIGGGKDIFEQATRGRAIGNILHAVVGQNNEGSVQGQGADALNQSIAGISSASLGAGAQQYTADTNFATNAAHNATEMNIERSRIAATPVPMGNTSGINNLNLPYNQTNYGQNVYAPGAAMPTLQPITPQREAPKEALIENASSTDKATGKPIVVKNGKWVAQ